MDSIFIIGAINAHENREVVTMDLPGVFLCTLPDEKIIMIMKGELCELMCKVEPKLCQKFITKDKKGNPVLYMQLYKLLYGLL